MMLLNLQSSRQILKIGGDYMEWTDSRRKRSWMIRCSICRRLIGYDVNNVKEKDCILDFASETGVYDNERHLSDVLDRHKERHDHLTEVDNLYTEEFFRKSRIIVNAKTNKDIRS